MTAATPVPTRDLPATANSSTTANPSRIVASRCRAPDHIPAHVAAEHADAAALVAARPPSPPRPPQQTGLASRPPRRPSPLAGLLALLVCAGLAASAAATDHRLPVRSEPAPADRSAPSAPCAPRQAPNPFAPLSPFACSEDAERERVLWKIVDVIRDREAA